MQTHYNAIKTQLGLDEALAPSSEDEKDDYICKYGLVLLIFFAEIITEQKKEFRRKMKQKRDELKNLIFKKRVDPIYEPK